MGSEREGMQAKVDRVFIGAGCNRVVNNVSWGASDLVAFGAQNAVAIFCPKVPLFLPFVLKKSYVLYCGYTSRFSVINFFLVGFFFLLNFCWADCTDFDYTSRS